MGIWDSVVRGLFDSGPDKPSIVLQESLQTLPDQFQLVHVLIIDHSYSMRRHANGVREKLSTQIIDLRISN